MYLVTGAFCHAMFTRQRSHCDTVTVDEHVMDLQVALNQNIPSCSSKSKAGCAHWALPGLGSTPARFRFPREVLFG
jgi:hypothetical protein